MKRRNEDLSFYNSKPISLMRIGHDLIKDTEPIRNIRAAHDNLSSGLKIVGWGLFGLFAIHQFTKHS
jgi:hypothetical protein